MTEKETTAILAILKTAYPQQLNKITTTEANAMIKLWTIQFHDVPSEIVLLAVQKLIGVSEFFPSIKQIKDTIKKIHYEAFEAINSHETACDKRLGFGTKLSKMAYKKFKYIFENSYQRDSDAELSLIDCIGGRYVDGVIECDAPLLNLDFNTTEDNL